MDERSDPPQIPNTVISGSSHFKWLEGEQFLIFRSHYDHPDVPDATSIIGDTDGLHMHYFNSRGVYRLYALKVTADGFAFTIGRHTPAGAFASSDAPFSQRMTYTFDNADQQISGKGQLSYDDVNWDDDPEIMYRRTS